MRFNFKFQLTFLGSCNYVHSFILLNQYVIRSEGSLKSEMLSTARTFKYVDNTSVLRMDNTSVLRINKKEEDS